VAAALIAVASHADAAGLFALDDGFDGMDGHLEIPVDDYGSYGRLFPSSVFDWFQPPGDQPDYPSYMAGAFLFVTTGGTTTSSVLLSEYDLWSAFLEQPPNEDGLFGMHTNLARTITTGISGSGANATSAFEVTASEFDIHVDLSQQITTSLPTATSVLAQVYTFRNDGTTPVDLVFHAAWEVDLYYDQGHTNGYANDVVGVVPGGCAVYIHNPASTTQAVALSSGSGTTLTTPPTYYGGKAGETPSMGPPILRSYSVGDAEQFVWLQHGLPASWRNYVSGAGYDTEGNSGTATGDASMGLEWRFTLAAGASQTIDVRRHYGTVAVPCGVAPTCGNGMVDGGETCDGADTMTCNGGTCMPSACGDGYRNTVAEECETIGIDSDTCNGGLCTAPACGDGYLNLAANELCDDGEETRACNANCQPTMCGDGYINAVAGEECEGGELCDPVACTVTFTVGGGCAGCGSSSDVGWLAGLALALTSRRRRRARRE